MSLKSLKKIQVAVFVIVWIFTKFYRRAPSHDRQKIGYGGLQVGVLDQLFTVEDLCTYYQNKGNYCCDRQLEYFLNTYLKQTTGVPFWRICVTHITVIKIFVFSLDLFSDTDFIGICHILPRRNILTKVWDTSFLFQYNLEDMQELVELFISGNPFCAQDGPMPHYYSAIQAVLPDLEIIDGVCPHYLNRYPLHTK